MTAPKATDHNATHRLELNWLLDGYDVWRMKGHEALALSALA